MKILRVMCDKCCNDDDLWHDGAMLRLPKDWKTIYCEDKAQTIDLHLCPKCFKKIFKEALKDIEAK